MLFPRSLRIERIAALPLEDKEALLRLVEKTIELQPGSDLVQRGENLSACHLVLDGLLCRYKLLRDGERHIIGFNIPGDFCDLPGFVMGRFDFAIGALRPATLAAIPYAGLEKLLDRKPRLLRAFWRETQIEAASARERIISVGHRSAYQRVAHLLCEMGWRLEDVGAPKGGFVRSMTQLVIGEATGLSGVHVNRTLRKFRAEGLIVIERNKIQVPDWKRLEQAADFDPDYLFMDRER